MVKKVMENLPNERNMKEYNQFIDKLNIELGNFLITPKEIWNETATRYVNGVAGEELRRLIKVETRRQYGAFFTESLMARQVLDFLKPSFNSKSIIYDPACGAGNLLISVADYFGELKIKLNQQIQLLGTDIHKEFVEVSKLRLLINSLLKNTNSSPIGYTHEIQKKYSIMMADGLVKNAFYESATHLFVNPPFNQVIPEEKVSWSSGKVSAAALFIDKIIRHSNPGVSICAILPDVLRSGTRYEKWREMIERECKIEKVKLLGQFDKYADVDVYAIKLVKRKKAVVMTSKSELSVVDNLNESQTLRDLFDICVGPVVDNRDAEEGPQHPYIVSRGLKGWSNQTEVILTRQHKGKIFNGPFVVVKRTSRMGDSQRAVATIINMSIPVFVDNHLIILKPKSGILIDCLKVLSILKDKRTDNWLNDKIRCRHLTVKIVADIPVWKQ